MPNPEHKPSLDPSEQTFFVDKSEIPKILENMQNSASDNLSKIDEAIENWKEVKTKSHEKSNPKESVAQEVESTVSDTVNQLGSIVVNRTVSFDGATNPNVIMFGPEDDTNVMPPKDDETK